MALNKIRSLDAHSFGVTIPKDDLRMDGVLDESGELEGEPLAYIQRDGPGDYILKVLEPEDL